MIFTKILIPEDKANHIVWGVVLSVGGVWLTNLLNISYIYAISLPIFIGALKEIIDKVTRKGTPDPYDFLLTVFGGILPILGVYLECT